MPAPSTTRSGPRRQTLSSDEIAERTDARRHRLGPYVCRSDTQNARRITTDRELLATHCNELARRCARPLPPNAGSRALICAGSSGGVSAYRQIWRVSQRHSGATSDQIGVVGGIGDVAPVDVR